MQCPVPRGSAKARRGCPGGLAVISNNAIAAMTNFRENFRFLWRDFRTEKLRYTEADKYAGIWGGIFPYTPGGKNNVLKTGRGLCPRVKYFFKKPSSSACAVSTEKTGWGGSQLKISLSPSVQPFKWNYKPGKKSRNLMSTELWRFSVSLKHKQNTHITKM